MKFAECSNIMNVLEAPLSAFSGVTVIATGDVDATIGMLMAETTLAIARVDHLDAGYADQLVTALNLHRSGSLNNIFTIVIPTNTPNSVVREVTALVSKMVGDVVVIIGDLTHDHRMVEHADTYLVCESDNLTLLKSRTRRCITGDTVKHNGAYYYVLAKSIQDGISLMLLAENGDAEVVSQYTVSPISTADTHKFSEQFLKDVGQGKYDVIAMYF